MLLSVWSYHLEQHIILLQTFRATTKYIHSGCQECWLLKSCWSGCKLPTVISNCKGQILTSFFVDMWPWMRPGFTTSIRKRNNSMQWKHPTSPPVVKFHKVISASKVMVSVFWDSESVLLTDYSEKGKTVSGTYYAGLIHKLREVIKEKRRGKLTQGVLLHHDNSPVHTSHVATATMHDCGFELHSHPPYSPDLAPPDFHLFRHLKESLCGQAFEDDEDVTVAVNEWIEERDQNFFLEGTKTLEQRWETSVALWGSYVKKHLNGLMWVDISCVFLITYWTPLVLLFSCKRFALLCFHSFCSQWQISTEVHWLSGLRSAKNKNKIRWTWLLLLQSSRLEHSSIRPSWHYWYDYILTMTQECTFWSCLQPTIAGTPGRIVWRHPTNLALIDWLKLTTLRQYGN